MRWNVSSTCPAPASAAGDSRHSLRMAASTATPSPGRPAKHSTGGQADEQSLLRGPDRDSLVPGHLDQTRHVERSQIGDHTADSSCLTRHHVSGLRHRSGRSNVRATPIVSDDHAKRRKSRTARNPRQRKIPNGDKGRERRKGGTASFAFCRGLGFRVVWDFALFGISRRSGFRAVWDFALFRGCAVRDFAPSGISRRSAVRLLSESVPVPFTA